MTTYSDEHWTDYVVVNNQPVFNLSNYAVDYVNLGDPFRINIPASLLSSTQANFSVNTADNPGNGSGCSPYNSLIYTVAVNLSTERSVVVPDAVGCVWNVTFSDGSTDKMSIPANYVGTNSCAYAPGNITYDANDAYQLGAYMIFNHLDLYRDGKIFVNLREEDLEVIVTTISRVPYMWGPSLVTLEVTR
jgi:hypothetical protein